MENHLIIGLGGTGGKVVAAYRRLMFEKYKGNLKPEGVWVEYLYLDSSEKDLCERGGIWNVMGTSVALEKGALVSIKAVNLKTYIDNIDNYPYLKPWIGTTDDWRNIVNDPKVQDGAAGQKRRLGRFLFANKAEEFNSALDAKVRRLQANPRGQSITFHVCCGLAGGTGSGSVIDVISQIRHNYPDHTIYRIMLYVLLPEEIPNKSWATTSNYQPNGYAALLELNALDYGIFKPWNVGERKFEVKRLDNTAPFYSVYVVTEQNKENVRFDVAKVIPATMAEFLFQKTIGIGGDIRKESSENKDSMMQRAETGENPDYNLYGYHHSFKFMTFGIKRLAIPEQEIREYFAYSYARQAVLQILYNNPSNEVGFQEEPLPNDDYSEVTKKEILDRWNLTPEYLCLSRPVLENHKGENWRSINDEYKVVDGYRMEIMQNNVIPYEAKLIAIANCTKDFYEKKFRPVGQAGGVAEFYKTKRKVGLSEIARKITGEIEADLFARWAKGEKSVWQLCGMTACLLDALEEQAMRFDKMIADAKATVTSKSAEMDTLGKEWPKVGLLGKTLFTSKKDTILSEYTEAVKMKYAMMTWCEAYLFGKELLQEIIGGLQTLRSVLEETNAMFGNALEIFNREIHTKCNDDLVNDADRQNIIIKHYNPQKVREIALRSIRQKEFAGGKVKEVREAIVGLLGEGEKRFIRLLRNVGLEGVISACQQQCLQLTELFFMNPENEREISGYEKLIGENILNKLRDQYNGNPIGLKDKLEELVRHAAVLVKYDETQRNDGPKVREGLLIVLPKYKDDEGFYKLVRDTFAGIQHNENYQLVEGGNPNEIVIVNIESNITPRYLQSVGTLRRAYDALMQSSSGRVAAFESHLETHADLPSLYKLSQAEKEEKLKKLQQEAIPDLLLAWGMNLIVPYEEPETGLTRLALITEDEFGLAGDPVLLGKDLESSVQKIDAASAAMLKENAGKMLAKDYRHVEKQKALIGRIVEVVNAIRANHGGSISDPAFLAFNNAAKEIVANLKKMNE